MCPQFSPLSYGLCSLMMSVELVISCGMFLHLCVTIVYRISCSHIVCVWLTFV